MASGVVRSLVTLVVIAAAGALIYGGRTAIAERNAALPPLGTAPETTLRVRPIEIVPGYSVERTFSGDVEARQTTDIAFELGGTVAAIDADDGDGVAAGDVLARLDTRLLDAEIARLAASRAALQAQAELARRTTRRQAELNLQGFASEQALDAASLSLAELEARTGEIDASLAAARVRRDKSVLRAPFDGEIAARHRDVGSMAAAGEPVLTLVERGARRFRVGVPPELAEQAPPGAELRVFVEGVAHPARVHAVLPRLDPTTLTTTLLFDVFGDPLPVIGETGRIHIPQRTDEGGAWVPLGALEAGTRGLWTLATVERKDGGYVVATEAAEILHSDGARAFVRGTFQDGTLFAVDGLHRVVPGQPVRISQSPDTQWKP